MLTSIARVLGPSAVVGVVLGLGLVVALQPAPTATAEDVMHLLQRVHNAEGVNLGAASTRDSRNAFLARVVGLITFGSARYNVAPDARWCLKNGGPGRPQSDDVVVLCATREAWDLVGGSGADNYVFHVERVGVLPAEQQVFPAPRPSDAGAPSPAPTPPPAPAPVCDLTSVEALAKGARDAAEAAHAEAAQARADLAVAAERISSLEAALGAALGRSYRGQCSVRPLGGTCAMTLAPQ